jgi:transcription initiation factor TFIIB
VADVTIGEIICLNCASIIVDKIPEDISGYGQFGALGEYAVRKSGTSSLINADMGLSSIMDQSGKDAFGRSLSGISRESFRRLSNWDKRSKAKANRGFQMPLTILQGITTKLGLPDSVEEEAAYLFRKCIAMGVRRKIGARRLIPSLIYITCRKLQIPRTLKDVADASDIGNKSLRQTYRRLVVELDINPETTKAENLIPQIASSLGLSEKIIRFAIQIALEYKATEVSAGKHPAGIAGASLYLSCLRFGIEIPQSTISKISGMSDVTIRSDTKSIKSTIPYLKNYQRITNRKINPLHSDKKHVKNS